MMMNDPVLAPDELFRRHQRGMFDPHSLFSQILLNMIEFSERQQQQTVLLEMIIATLSGLSRDVAAMADLLGMIRPSQLGPEGDQAEGDESNEADDSKSNEAGTE